MNKKRILILFLLPLIMLMSIIIILINANKNNVQIEPKVENNTENNSNVEKTNKKIVSYDLTKLIENYISLKNIDKNSLAISIHSANYKLKLATH